jgi:ABC-2 type transport system ATP-binding protein
MTEGHPPAVEARGLTHRYAKSQVDALSELSFDVQPGEAFALLGPNGGGKSTTFRILTGQLRPNASNDAAIRLFGSDLLTQPAAARALLGVVFQSPSLDIKLTAIENLFCHGRLYGMNRKALATLARDTLEQMGLDDRRDERVESFSGGMRRRVEIAKALLTSPRLLIMDEPTTGLDPAARRQLWASLEEAREIRGLTLLWTTHLMDEAEQADRVAILADGKRLALGSPADLKQSLGESILTIRPRDPQQLDAVLQTLRKQFTQIPPGDFSLIQQEIRLQTTEAAAMVQDVIGLLGSDAAQVAVGPPTLEDVYLHHTARRIDTSETVRTTPPSEPAPRHLVEPAVTS